jgi:hypothetical protein
MWFFIRFNATRSVTNDGNKMSRVYRKLNPSSLTLRADSSESAVREQASLLHAYQNPALSQLDNRTCKRETEYNKHDQVKSSLSLAGAEYDLICRMKSIVTGTLRVGELVDSLVMSYKS